MDMTTQQTLCSVSNFCAGYDRHMVVRDLAFSLPCQTLTALIGINGSGKSTLLKGLCRLISSSGTCRLHPDGSDSGELCFLDRLSPRQLSHYISYIPQRMSQPPALPVLDIVLMGFEPSLHLLQTPGASHRAVAQKALQAVGMYEMQNRNFQTLSEGQKQLVILARALVQDSSLLLLDEPDSALDFSNRRMILQTLRNIVTGKPKAALLILHDPALALDCCDQLLLLKDGTLNSILHPSTDSEEYMSEAFSRLYGPVRVFRHDGHCFLYS